MANLLLNGKVAFITGANNLGKAIARKFVKEGATVFLADSGLKYNDCKNTAVQLTTNPNNPEAHAVDCKVSSPSDILKAFNDVTNNHNKIIDIFYNNADVNDDLSSISSKTFENTMEVNVHAVLESIKHAGDVMQGNPNGGCIICTGSTMGLLGDVVPSVLSISKTTALSVIRAAAVELASKDVRVNAISPASFDLHSLPQPLWCPPSANKNLLQGMIKNSIGNLVSDEDVANAAVFLASEYGKSVNGHNLVLSGKFPIY